MCFKALRTSFRTKRGSRGSPPHQLTESDTRPVSPANAPSPQPNTPYLPIDLPIKPAEASPGALQGVLSFDDDTNAVAEDTPRPTNSNWKATTWNAAKLTLRLVKESADAFPPLKAVAGGLCELINDFEQTTSNKESIQGVILRIKNLNESTKQGTPQNSNEKKRRGRLESNLTDISIQLDRLLQGNVFTRFVNNVEDAQIITGLVEDIRDALMDYQISLQQDIYDMNCKLMASDDCKTLDKLPRAQHAGRYADRKGCLKGTRVELLMEIQTWSVSKGDRPIYWLNGGAGTGKSTISQSLAERWFADDRPGASFFFSRDHVDRKNIELVFPTIAFQLAYQLPAFRSALIGVINRRDVREMSLAEQLQYLLTEPLQSLDGTSVSDGPPIVIVIDALDECDDDEPESKFLSLLSENISDIPFVKFFITSRPEKAIRSIFNRPLKHRTRTLILQDIDTAIIDRDVSKYLQARLSMATTRTDVKIEAPWPPPGDIAIIVQQCGGLFIYASTVVEFILSDFDHPQTRLRQIVSMPDGSTTEEVALKIDPLYTQVVTHGFSGITPGNLQLFERVRLVVASILFALNPLPSSTLATLLDLDPGDITRAIFPLHSVLLVPDDESKPIRRFHKSFPDFITDPGRCKDPKFFVDRCVYHGKITIHCLNLMKTSLKKNICSIPRYQMNADVKDLPTRRRQHIGDAVEYACWFWTDHLSLASKGGECVDLILRPLKGFFEHHVLLWIEIFSIADSLGDAVYSIRRVQQWIVDAGITDLELRDLIYDCYRFILRFFDIIRVSVPHIYHSALPFLPTSSRLRSQHQGEISKEANVLMGAGISWNACIRQSHGSGEAVRVTFSSDGKLIARDGGNNVEIFDATTGVRQASLEGHTDYVVWVTFSPDNKLLVSGSWDCTIKIWDVQTGGLVRTLEGHNEYVSSVSFSPEGERLASGSRDCSVRIWDASSGDCIAVLEGHPDHVGPAYWLNDVAVVSAGREDGTVKLWDVSTKTCTDLDIPKHVGDWYVACSADGTKIASGPTDTSIHIYEVHTGIARTIETGDKVSSVCFSPKGDQILYGSSTHLYIRDLSLDDSPPILVGQTLSAKYVRFSADGISIASIDDETVKIWQNWDNQTLYCHLAEIYGVYFSADGQLAASASKDKTIKMWDVATTACLHTIHCGDSIARSIALSSDRLFVASINGDNVIKIWDVCTDQLVHEMTGDSSNLEQIQFSPDGCQIVSASWESIRVWDRETGAILAVVPSYFSFPERIRFDENGVIVLKVNNALKRWKLSSAPVCAPTPIEDHTDRPGVITDSSKESPSAIPDPIQVLIPDASLHSDASSIPDVAIKPVSMPLVLVPLPEGEHSDAISPFSHLEQYRMEYDDSFKGDGWILDQLSRRVCHVLEARVFACHGQKVIVGTEGGNVVIMDFQNTNSSIE